MENNKNKKSVKFQGDMLNFYDFIHVFVFTRNHHLNSVQYALESVQYAETNARLPQCKVNGHLFKVIE